ncbi:MAG: diacylglycerol kinase family lipid kinase [Alphaproteobacteria bacterium]|nr:diacylglycerol kinase family lipid kinase [Alphaproteobacteria bacterium]
MIAEGSIARKRILLVANPTAGRGRGAGLKPIVDRLEGHGCSVTVYQTKAAGDAERFVREAGGAGFDAIAAAGGDGTINEVLNGLSAGGPPLAIIPLGTVNVLAKEIGLPQSIDRIAETVAFGPSRPISVGDANGRRFAVMASVGLDAEVVENVNLDLKRHVGKWAYLYETARQIAFSSPPPYRLRFDHEEQEAQGIIIANGRFYGGRYVAAPEANLENPSLEVCRLTRPGRWAAPGYLLSLCLGRLAERADVRIDRATGLEITGPAGAPLQADGDVLCRLPAIIKVLPAAVDLVFPIGSNGRAGS